MTDDGLDGGLDLEGLKIKQAPGCPGFSVDSGRFCREPYDPVYFLIRRSIAKIKKIDNFFNLGGKKVKF
jgi:hypothetical protein